MSEKVVITREQAKAIEQNYAYSNKVLLKLHAQDDHKWSDQWYWLNGMDFDTLAKALYIGYEVEPTPEEIILWQYKESSKKANDSEHSFEDYHQGQVDAIEMVLRTLKIEIEGIHK